MMKAEFEGLVNEEISSEEYAKVETVYMYYPGVKEKGQIVELYNQFRMVIIEDMLPRAKEIQIREEKISALKIEISKLTKGTFTDEASPKMP